MTTIETAAPSALRDFQDAFADVYADKPRQKHRGPQYIRTYKRATELRRDRESGGIDLGDFGRSSKGRKRG